MENQQHSPQVATPIKATYYDRHKEALKIKHKIYYQEHRRKLLTNSKNYYEENKEEVLAKGKKSEKKKEYNRAYYHRNKVKQLRLKAHNNEKNRILSQYN